MSDMPKPVGATRSRPTHSWPTLFLESPPIRFESVQDQHNWPDYAWDIVTDESKPGSHQRNANLNQYEGIDINERTSRSGKG